MDAIDLVAQEVAKAVKKQLFIEVEASGRHVHLTCEAIETLFGKGHQLSAAKALSQPGQYAAKERVSISGPKGALTNVVVLGPARADNQVEISQTDALALGIKAPVRQSGEIEGSAAITISTEKSSLQLQQGAIIALRHIHMHPDDAARYGVCDGEMVSIKVLGKRPVVFAQTMVRVSPKFQTRMHIDYDEANACGFTPGTLGIILKERT